MYWTREDKWTYRLPGTSITVRKNAMRKVHQVFDGGVKVLSDWATFKRAKTEAEWYYARKEKP